MILLILVRRSFRAFPSSTSVFCSVSSDSAAGFSALVKIKFARRCGWHRNFQISTSIFHDILEWVIINVKGQSRNFSSIVEFLFVGSQLLCFCEVRRIGHIFPNPCHAVSGMVVCFLVSLSLGHVFPSGGSSFKKVNLVETCPWI